MTLSGWFAISCWALIAAVVLGVAVGTWWIRRRADSHETQDAGLLFLSPLGALALALNAGVISVNDARDWIARRSGFPVWRDDWEWEDGR